MKVFQITITDNFGERKYLTIAADMDTGIQHVRCMVADAAEDPVDDVQAIEAKMIPGEVVIPAFKMPIKPADPSGEHER